jgi:hypothetical protein
MASCGTSYKRKWFPRDIVVHRGTGEFSFDLSLAENSNSFDFAKEAGRKTRALSVDGAV